MADINWEPLIITRQRAASKVPTITINIDSGRFTLNGAACELIPNCYSYKYIEIYCGTIDNTLKKVRIHFSNTKTIKSIPFSQRKCKGSYTHGATFHTKDLSANICKSFTELPKTCRFLIDVQNQANNKYLIFDIDRSYLF